MKRLPFLMGVLLLLLLASGERWPWATAAELALPIEDVFIAPLGDKPEQNWRVCRDLGVGNVPGLGIRRQRFRLCHAQGWEVLVYCLEPNLPVPAVGTRCTRTDANTYWCGSGLQRLREYSVQETPTSAPTRTAVPTNTPTLTSTATPTPPTPPSVPSAPPQERATPKAPPRATRRAPAGGRGNFDLSGLFSLDWLAAPTRTPFQPRLATPTPFQPRHPTAVVTPATSQPSQPPAGFYGLDLEDPSHRVRILIFPSNQRVNQGKPILISFIPGQTCNYGDNRACVNIYPMDSGAEVTFITIHSGVGGEGQAFRNAVEGTGINSAGLSLKEIRANLKALDGAEVVIIQGKRRYEGFTLSVAARIPPKFMRAYFEAPVQEALLFASTVDGRLRGASQGSLPLLVFETCGWKVPSEAWARGVTSTTASIYLGVIQKKP